MAQIDATTGGSYKVERGDRRVRVGIMDTGVAGVAPTAHRHRARLSRAA